MLHKKHNAGIVLAAALLLLSACGQVVQTEPGTAITTEQAVSTKPAGTMPTVSITEIDMSAPESGKYREWMENYFENHEFHYSRYNRPEHPGQSVRKTGKETWTTWDWSDTWKLELYENRRGKGRQILRARSKKTRETQEINRSDCLNGTDGEVVHVDLDRIVDEAHLLYSVSRTFSNQKVYFYTLGQGSDLIMTKPVDCHEQLTFADKECTLLLWDTLEGPPEGGIYSHLSTDQYIYSIWCADLRKLSANDSDATKIVAQPSEFVLNYEPLLNGRYLLVQSRGDDGREIDGFQEFFDTVDYAPIFFYIYDVATGDEVCSWQLPKIMERHGSLSWVDENTQYYFEELWLSTDGNRYSSHDDSVKTVEQVSFFEIHYEFPEWK